MTQELIESLHLAVRHLSPQTDHRTPPFRPADVATWLTHNQLQTLKRIGAVSHIRHGWYCLESVHPVLHRAARLGGVVTCASALVLRGAWESNTDLHLRVRRGPVHRTGLTLHCDNSTSVSRLLDDPVAALERACRCLEAEELTILADSALNLGLLTTSEYEGILGRLSRRQRHKVRFVDGRAESGSESRVRFWLQSLGHHVQPQAYFRGVGRVDLLVNGAMVIECDSMAHHLGDQHFRDRDRDLKLGAQTIPVHRLSHRQVWHQWAATRQYLLAILDHL